jgi:hypothetical protein
MCRIELQEFIKFTLTGGAISQPQMPERIDKQAVLLVFCAEVSSTTRSGSDTAKKSTSGTLS